jgi:amidase
VLLGTGEGAPPDHLVVATDLLALADGEVAATVARAAAELGATLGVPVTTAELAPRSLDAWLLAFRARQLVEAWQSHGAWITRRRPTFGPGITARFAAAAAADPAGAAAADQAADDVRAALARVIGPRGALVLPAAATVAPRPDLDAAAKDDLRRRTMVLTCIAGLAGAPALSMPVAGTTLPIGLCLVAARGADEMLLAAASRG